MEITLLQTVHDLVANSKTTRVDANLAALLLINAPYFEGGHEGRWFLGKDKNGEVRLVQKVADEVLLRDPALLFSDKGGRDIYEADRVSLESLDSTTHRKAKNILDQIRKKNPEMFQQLFHPTEDQMVLRKKLTYEMVSAESISDRLSGILGNSYYIDGKLKTQGLEYHCTDTDRKGFYLLAHNGQEVAGVLFLSHYRPWTYGINYLTVAPAFRKCGVASELFSRAIAKCDKDKKVLVRTDPGEYTHARPKITQSFDRQCLESNIMHVMSNSYLMGGVGRALEKSSYEDVMVKFKPLCDKHSLSAGDKRWRNDQDTLQVVKDAEEALTDSALASKKKRRTP